MNAPERIAAQAGFLPDLRIEDPLAHYWVRTTMLHLRREVCWRWHLAQQARGADSGPAFTLDLARHTTAKAEFFARDVAAAYIGAALEAPPPAQPSPRRGSFGWVMAELELDAAGAFVLGLGLLSCLDHSAGEVITECSRRRMFHPSLALAQTLWSRPEELVDLADRGHPLWRRGLLQPIGGELAGTIDWQSAYAVPAALARLLAFPDSQLPARLAPLNPPVGGPLTAALADAAARLRDAHAGSALRAVPVAGAYGADFAGTIGALCACAGREVRRLHVDAALRGDPAQLRALFAAAWLRDVHILLGDDAPRVDDAAAPHAFLNEMRDVPVTVFVPSDESAALGGVAEALRHSTIEIPRLTYEERVAAWRRELRPEDDVSASALAECARRFRFEPVTLRAAAARFRETPMRGARALVQACRATMPLELGGLAERVEPRITVDELVLAAPLRRQFDEIARAMRELGEVHHRWGTARAWNEAGLAILLSGPPGCGKGAFAECLAQALDLPLYRVDLSQVVNKYIGETEKNLKRLFDAADVADAILFFDEADAIFGKRVEVVRDAHDRYISLQVGFLLSRVERFKGLAILATNRRRDLDDAFMRRLRAVVELPLPECAQRAEMWRKAVPPGADGSSLDCDFLGRQFNLTGGHIRSAMLNACLQSAAGQHDAERPRLAMEPVIVAIKRELDKLRRSSAPAQFGAYAGLARELERD